MKSGIRVATQPPKPLMVFDGDCNFCTLWIRRWKQITGETVDYLPAQDPAIPAQFPEIPDEQFNAAVQLIETDGAVYSGAEAVFRSLARNPKRRWLLNIYASSPAFASITEWTYRLVAGNRTIFSLITRWFWGRHVEAPAYFLTRWVFLRGLGVIYLIAFISLWGQIGGLIGHDGILPTNQFMSAAAQQFDSQGIGLDRFRQVPTLCWFNSSDTFLDVQCAAGVTLASLLILDVAPVPCLAFLWLLYLSLVTVGRNFLGFQWDSLLLECGFLAIFFAPLRWLPRKPWKDTPPSRIMLWLLRLLLFKLMFSSGCVKLLSGDPSWRNLAALTFHYYTQPLPTWIAWYANQLPFWFQKTSCILMFCIELGAPWLFFAPRRLRFCGAAAVAFLQIAILLTGNYTFFNLFTLTLCLLLLDDFVLKRFLPHKLRGLFTPYATHRTPGPLAAVYLCRRVAVSMLAIIFVPLYFFQVAILFKGQPGWMRPLARVDAWLEPFRTINGYGLFAVMTTERREIIVEGSNDGVKWLPYEFKYKPGDLNRRPAFVAPHQPRLDWQMWFAALGDYQQNPWFLNFCLRLLQGSPDVLGLLKGNPFPDHPPRYIRAELYSYRFTDFSERRASGAWWKRTYIGQYLPAVSLQNFTPSRAGLRTRFASGQRDRTMSDIPSL